MSLKHLLYVRYMLGKDSYIAMTTSLWLSHVQYVHRIPSILDWDKHCSTEHTVPYRYKLPWLNASSTIATVRVCVCVCVCVCVYIYIYIILIRKPTRWTYFSNLFFGIKLYMFWTVPLSIIRSFFTVHTATVYVIQVCCVYSEKTPDDGQRNCPKHVEFIPKINLRN